MTRLWLCYECASCGDIPDRPHLHRVANEAVAAHERAGVKFPVVLREDRE